MICINLLLKKTKVLLCVNCKEKPSVFSSMVVLSFLSTVTRFWHNSKQKNRLFRLSCHGQCCHHVGGTKDRT